MKLVKISAKWVTKRCNGCQPDYIRNVCHGSCCRTSNTACGTWIPIRPVEAPVLAKYPGVVVDTARNLLLPSPGEHHCPFQQDWGGCGLHGSPDKPQLCVIDPFILVPRKAPMEPGLFPSTAPTATMVIRHRYMGMKCYKDFRDTGTPAYRAYAFSLRRAFGDEEAERIVAHFDTGSMVDLVAQMPDSTYQDILDEQQTLRATREKPTGKWGAKRVG